MKNVSRVSVVLSFLALSLAAFAHHDANMRIDDLEKRVLSLNNEIQDMKNGPIHQPVRLLNDD
ncbi:hypothetical protein CMI47_19500 [Candidatus Pacearchaeota archaeon]|nr:hypothetical protein [Candidatus Pacearchaeota archaeon]|tara:strand:+ start:441 stop:629 length:189 start_codon:yes stop_codon:yes gene_type:complete